MKDSFSSSYSFVQDLQKSLESDEAKERIGKEKK
jgi:hypothetical protein